MFTAFVLFHLAYIPIFSRPYKQSRYSVVSVRLSVCLLSVVCDAGQCTVAKRWCV